MWLVFLIGAVIGGVATYVVYRVYINREILKEEARNLKLKLEFKRKLKARISEIINEGEYSTVKISLFEENAEVAELEVRGETIDNDVYEGMRLTV